ncbi:acyl-CoA synthetase [Nocardioides aestuarii]|uniref:Class I adenylate-forming enzyme family protein n=1 Tax=Nocardioides aestuarii TaxID=252231 RepID=A0ABW4TIL7_9ACTN
MFPDLPPGARVALLQPGSTPYVETVVGLLAAGVFPVPLDPHLTAVERERALADVDPVLVVDTPEALASLHASIPPARRHGLPLGRPMHVTSGTTGRPKAVFSGVLGEDAATALLQEERELWGFREDDVNLVVSPIHHSAPLRFATGTLLAGGRLVFAGAFDAARLTELIATERPTTMFVVPTHLHRLLAHWDADGAPDLSCVRLLAHAGAACPPDLKRRLVETFPPGSTWEFYGSTEGQFTACRSEEWLQRPGTVGRARPGRRISVDDRGTVWCVVPPHARFDYFRSPGKTAEAWRATAEGPAFTVGDLGRLDDDGYLYLDGRREDLVISGGVNVYPVEVENALREHPGVVDVAVYGVADAEWGQRVCAAVVGTASVEDLTAYARERLSPAKRPRTWRFLDELPHTPTGKVLRSALG